MWNKALLAVIAALALAPLWFLLSGSFLGASRLLAMPPALFPRNPVISNYMWVFTRPDVPLWALNTLAVTLSTAFLSTVVSLMAGAAFGLTGKTGKSRGNSPRLSLLFHVKQFLWPVLLSALMVPRIALLIPLFIVSARIGINGTLAAVVLPLVFTPAGMFTARAFIKSIPVSLIEAARMDGATEAQVLVHVVAPVSRPLVALLALLSGVAALQDWVWQALQLQDSERFTLLVGWVRAVSVRVFGDDVSATVGHSMAIGVLLLFPLLVLFIIANRYFIGALEGAEKG